MRVSQRHARRCCFRFSSHKCRAIPHVAFQGGRPCHRRVSNRVSKLQSQFVPCACGFDSKLQRSRVSQSWAKKQQASALWQQLHAEEACAATTPNHLDFLCAIRVPPKHNLLAGSGSTVIKQETSFESEFYELADTHSAVRCHCLQRILIVADVPRAAHESRL